MASVISSLWNAVGTIAGLLPAGFIERAKKTYHQHNMNVIVNDLNECDLSNHIPDDLSKPDARAVALCGSIKDSYLSRMTNFYGSHIQGGNAEGAVLIAAYITDPTKSGERIFGQPVREYLDKYHTSKERSPKNLDKAIVSKEEGFAKLEEFLKDPNFKENRLAALQAFNIIEQIAILCRYRGAVSSAKDIQSDATRLRALAILIKVKNPLVADMATARAFSGSNCEVVSLQYFGIKKLEFSAEANAIVSAPDARIFSETHFDTDQKGVTPPLNTLAAAGLGSKDTAPISRHSTPSSGNGTPSTASPFPASSPSPTATAVEKEAAEAKSPEPKKATPASTVPTAGTTNSTSATNPTAGAAAPAAAGGGKTWVTISGQGFHLPAAAAEAIKKERETQAQSNGR